MAYTSGLPAQGLSGIDAGLYSPKNASVLFREYMRVTPWVRLMGSNMDAPIYTHQMRAGDGLVTRIPRLRSLDYEDAIIGSAQKRGKEKILNVDYDEITTQEEAFGVQENHIQVVELGTDVKVTPHIREQMLEGASLRLEKAILRAITFDNYPDLATQKPVYDRILLAGADVDRPTYNGYAGLRQALNALSAGPDANENGLSAEGISKIKLMADLGGADSRAETYIRPAKTRDYAGFPLTNYYLFVDPGAVPALYRDPLFNSTTISRGAILPNQPQVINGADYIGEYDGAYVYRLPKLTEYRVKSADGNVTAAWNMLIGAGALALYWYKKPWMIVEPDRVEDLVNYYIKEYRGQKALRFPGKQNSAQKVEQGIIHFFTRLNP